MLAYATGVEGQQPGARRWDAGLAPCLGTFVLGGIAQGAPFVLVAASLERQDAGSGWLAVVAAVRLAPYLVCSPVAGAIAGRYAPQRVFAVSSLARWVVIVALWVALRAGSAPGMLVVLLFVLVAVGTPTFPALMRAVKHTVRPARLDRASTLAAGLESAAFCAGPALGGLLLVVTDTSASLVVCAAMMLASAGLAGCLPTTGKATRPLGRLPEQPIRTAGRSLLVESRIRPAMVAVLGVNVLAGLDAALLVRLPAGLDLGGERTVGLLSFAHGAGAFGAFVALIGPMPRAPRPIVPLATAATAVCVLSLTSELSVAAVAACAVGASILTAEVVATRDLSRTLPGSLLAPAFGVLDALMVAAMIAGAAVAPILTSFVGLRPTLAVAGIATPLLAIGALHRRRSHDPTVVEPQPRTMQTPRGGDTADRHRGTPTLPSRAASCVPLAAGRDSCGSRR
jgi:MFS family permease